MGFAKAIKNVAIHKCFFHSLKKSVGIKDSILVVDAFLPRLAKKKKIL